jgi:hypothetical protein
MIFGRRKNGGSAVADARPEVAEAERLESRGDLFGAIDLLCDANRASRDGDLEMRIRHLRHLAGADLLANAVGDPSYAEPEGELPPPGEYRMPEVTPDQLSAGVLRKAILEYGCLLVRGLMDSEKALAMADDIDHAFEVRKSLSGGASDPEGYYSEMTPVDPFEIGGRNWVEEGGGVLAADSPRLMFDMLEALDQAGLREVLAGYLGEKPVISAQKCTLRKATPDVSGSWHQDGKFLGSVRSMNVWLALSRCGDVAPSMDVIPRRLEEYAETATHGAVLDYTVGHAVAEQVAGDVGIVRPIFDPGDALLFDHLFLHQTGSDPSMPNPRYAIESWFFGPSAYPAEYAPVAF